MNGQLYKATDLLHKTLVANKKLIAYWDYVDNKDFFIIDSGSVVGQPFAWTIEEHAKGDNKNGLFFVFSSVHPVSKLTKQYFVKHSKDSFNTELLIKQGLKRVGEKKTFLHYAEKYAPVVGAAASGIYIGGRIISVILDRK